MHFLRQASRCGLFSGATYRKFVRSWNFIRRSAARAVLRTGLGFLVLQICVIGVSQCDAFLITQFLSAEQVTPYSVGQRVFAQVVGLVSVLITPLWPAFGHAKALGDVEWIRRAYRRINGYFLALYFGVFLLMAFLGHYLLALWVWFFFRLLRC